MISKQQFIEGFMAELSIIRHLATKVEPTMLDYRPTEKQRSTAELLNYLGHIFNLGTDLVVQGNSNNYMELAQKAPVVTLENFDSVMEAQAEEVRKKIYDTTDEAMDETIEIFGWSASRAMHFMGIMKWAVAYKMQLFLYLKVNGKPELSTQNLWRGTDPAPKA